MFGDWHLVCIPTLVLLILNLHGSYGLKTPTGSWTPRQCCRWKPLDQRDERFWANCSLALGFGIWKHRMWKFMPYNLFIGLVWMQWSTRKAKRKETNHSHIFSLFRILWPVLKLQVLVSKNPMLTMQWPLPIDSGIKETREQVERGCCVVAKQNISRRVVSWIWLLSVLVSFILPISVLIEKTSPVRLGVLSLASEPSELEKKAYHQTHHHPFLGFRNKLVRVGPRLSWSPQAAA